jgi:hypothetical protein
MLDSWNCSNLCYELSFPMKRWFRPRLDRKYFEPVNSTIFVLFDKYCSIVDQLGSKDSSRDFQLNYVISFFYLHLLLHAWVQRLMWRRKSEKILTFGVHLKKALALESCLTAITLPSVSVPCQNKFIVTVKSTCIFWPLTNMVTRGPEVRCI